MPDVEPSTEHIRGREIGTENVADTPQHEIDLMRGHIDVAAYGRDGRYSTLVAALKDARGATGRDGESGVPYEGSPRPSWLGALGYLMLIDQVGATFTTSDPLGPRTGTSIGFLRGLADFSTLSSQQRWALYSLRCSLAHNYSLFNTPRDGARSRHETHAFRLTNEELQPGEVVRLPDHAWDGDIKNTGKEVRTVVDLAQLGDLVERVVTTVLPAHLNAATLTCLMPFHEFERHFSWRRS